MIFRTFAFVGFVCEEVRVGFTNKQAYFRKMIRFFILILLAVSQLATAQTEFGFIGGINAASQKVSSSQSYLFRELCANERNLLSHILIEAKTLNLVYECPQGNTRTALHDMETIYDFIVEKSLFFFAELLVSRTLR